MSTQNIKINKDQEVPPQTPGSFYHEDTLQRRTFRRPGHHLPAGEVTGSRSLLSSWWWR
ncbi:MAG TPA: hypothetical protein VFQ36_00430 [Ktedonobacteraceae bacterium]|nr:hypothetical protein [Ktedonobacteraceae bacterium]